MPEVTAGLPQVLIDRQQVAMVAYHRFLARGAVHGGDVDDWLEAERACLRPPGARGLAAPERRWPVARRCEPHRVGVPTRVGGVVGGRQRWEVSCSECGALFLQDTRPGEGLPAPFGRGTRWRPA